MRYDYGNNIRLTNLTLTPYKLKSFGNVHFWQMQLSFLRKVHRDLRTVSTEESSV